MDPLDLLQTRNIPPPWPSTNSKMPWVFFVEFWIVLENGTSESFFICLCVFLLFSLVGLVFLVLFTVAFEIFVSLPSS